MLVLVEIFQGLFANLKIYESSIRESCFEAGTYSVPFCSSKSYIMPTPTATPTLAKLPHEDIHSYAGGWSISHLGVNQMYT